MNASSLRWTLGGLLGLTAVVQSLRAMTGLAGRGASLGVVALFALATLTVLGLVSLGRARRRIGRELAGLDARPATGELIATRRARLARIAEAGATPDRDALAEASIAAERGQAYLGRYLVAVAVLIGLVGTFSGLAEALRGLPAILGGAAVDPQKLAALLSAPLAGLDVTFAAGIVGILSTLALALVQGDLQLHEELALARLEEETTHELIPALWPRAQSVEERTARELAGLRADNATLLAAAGEAIGEKVADVSARTARELADRLTAAVEASTRRLADEVSRGLAETLKSQLEVTRSIREEGAAQLAVLKHSGEALTVAAARGNAELAERFVAESTALREAMIAAQTAQIALAEELRVRSVDSAAQIGAQLGALHREVGSQAEATQLTLVEHATRAADGATAAWTTVRETLASELGAVRGELTTSIDQVRVALTEDAAAARSALEACTTKTVATLEQVASESTRAFTDGAAKTTHALADNAENSARVLTETSERSARALTETSERVSNLLGAQVELASLSLSEQVERTTRVLADGAASLLSATATELGATRAALTEAAAQASVSLGHALGEGNGRLEALLAASRQDLADTLGAGRDAVERLVTDSVGALGSSASALSQSADTLARTAGELAPQLESLTPELRALTQEVALLGSRAEKDDEPLFADELVRLGEGMSRLEALVRLSQGSGEGARS